MTQRIRLLIVMARPAVVILLGLFAATGLAQAGRPDDPLLLFRALLVVAGFLVCSVVVNDFADEAIDRVNLSGDPSRPSSPATAAGRCTRRSERARPPLRSWPPSCCIHWRWSWSPPGWP